MTEAISSVRSEFFGKDSFTPFIGRVEDVNDPKMSGRCKVRCIGWHPKDKNGEDGLSTEDLPWARVGLPTTMAQQGRIGGKHGLLNGCWVFGFFLDGSEAQDPIILNTFNFTAKASDKNNRKPLKGQDGTDDPSDETFTNSEMSPKTTPNTATSTTKEKGRNSGDPNDPARATWASDADGKCGDKPLQSAAANTRQTQKSNNIDTPEAQEHESSQADGMCGSTSHARDDISLKFQKYMPAAISRFSYNDAVWNRFSGEYMDLNGIMAQLATIICNLLKQPINSSKSFTNELNRKLKSAVIQVIPDRDGFLREKAEKTNSVKNDIFNGVFQTSFIDILCSLMMNMIQAMNNENESSDGDNLTGNIGASPDTLINNTQAICIADTILSNVDAMTQSAIELSLEIAKERSEREDDEEDNDTIGEIMGILSGLSSVMQFPLIQKYAMRPDVFNAAGPASQDILTKTTGCRQDRVYNNAIGALGSLMGAGSGAGGGGSESGQGRGSSDSRGTDRYQNVGFGGYPGKTTGEVTNKLCEEAYAIPYKDGEEKPLVYPSTDSITPISGSGGTGAGGGTGGGTGAGGGTGGGTGNGGTGAGGGTGNGGTGNGTGNGGTGNGTGNDGTGAGGGTGNGTGNDGTNNGYDGPTYVKLPGGNSGEAITISLPSKDKRCAKNYIQGTPNQVVIVKSGKRYYYNNERDDRKVFPSIFIKGYKGTPLPVVDKGTGELVAILVNCVSFNPNYPNTNISVIPDNNQNGITTDDPNYDIVLGGIFISNTGFDYKNPTISVFDKDKMINSNALVTPVVVDGRIVDYDIINSGSGFRRLPEIRVDDETGYGSRLYPIMSVVPKTESKPPLPPVQMIYCPSNQQNLF